MVMLPSIEGFMYYEDYYGDLDGETQLRISFAATLFPSCLGICFSSALAFSAYQITNRVKKETGK